MLVAEGYHKTYYQEHKEKSKVNFQRWYSKSGNKEKMRKYMREYMRKKRNIKKENFRFKEYG